MGKGIVKLGEGKWAVKDGNLLAAKETNGRFKNTEFTVSRGTDATYVNRDGLIVNETGDDFVYPEGCLSIPNISENVVRKEKLKIKFLDENLKSQTISCSGIIARVIQHEYDHLQGILFTDKLSYKKRKSLKQELNLISIGDVEVKYKMRFFKKK